jgi:hypothetical protein
MADQGKRFFWGIRSNSLCAVGKYLRPQPARAVTVRGMGRGQGNASVWRRRDVTNRSQVGGRRSSAATQATLGGDPSRARLLPLSRSVAAAAPDPAWMLREAAGDGGAERRENFSELAGQGRWSRGGGRRFRPEWRRPAARTQGGGGGSPRLPPAGDDAEGGGNGGALQWGSNLGANRRGIASLNCTPEGKANMVYAVLFLVSYQSATLQSALTTPFFSFVQGWRNPKPAARRPSSLARPTIVAPPADLGGRRHRRWRSAVDRGGTGHRDAGEGRGHAGAGRRQDAEEQLWGTRREATMMGS